MTNHDNDHDSIDPRIAAAAAEGCEESRLLVSRRAFMGITASLFTWAYMPRSALALDEQPRLLIVILRGGMDGLHVAPPIKDRDYISARRHLALDANDVLPLNDDLFMLHRNLPNFHKSYMAGDAAIIHGIAPPLQARSHFECQYNLEAGLGNTLDRTKTDGWLNRLLQKLEPGDPLKKTALQAGSAPMILAGSAEILGWTPGIGAANSAFITGMQNIYNARDDELAKNLENGVKTRNSALAGAGTQNRDLVIQAFAGAGRLLSNSFARIAVLSVEGWDTHSNQSYNIGNRLTLLDDALAALKSSLGTSWNKTAIACVTEFGRTVMDNGGDGSDHGTGTVALLMGGAVNGGKVFRKDWRGLKTSALKDNRDLWGDIDTRSLFKGLLRDHLGVVRQDIMDYVFPPDDGRVAAMDGLVKVASKAAVTATASPAPATMAAADAEPLSSVAQFRLSSENQQGQMQQNAM